MAYGYYSDPGASFGKTGESQTQQNETYIQRQKRLQTQQAPQMKTSTGASQPTATAAPAAAPAPTGGTGTPVSGNGGIPPPTPMAPAPQAAPAPAPVKPPNYNGGPTPPAGQQDPFGGKGVWYGAGWAPADHPLAIEAVKKHNAAASAAPAAAGAVIGAPGTALGGPAPAASGVFTQAAPPPHDFQNWQQLDMVSRLLASPETMSPEILAKQKQASIEEAILMAQQQQTAADEEAAASGFALNGGRRDAQMRATNENLMNAILGQNRELEIAASQQNRLDQLNALQAAEQILGGQVGRGSQVYGDILAGQGANRSDYWTGKGQELQKYGIDKGVDVDLARLASGESQFGRNLAEQARQFNSSEGRLWAGMSADQQSAMMRAIMGLP